MKIMLLFVMLLMTPLTNATDKPLVLAGDSMIEIGDWSLLLKDCNSCPFIINAGVGGNTTKNLFNRYEKDVLAHHPSIIVIQIGTNDFNYQGYTPEKAFESIKELVYMSLKSSPELKVIINSVFPVLENKLKNSKIVRLNRLLDKEFSNGLVNGVYYLNIYDEFLWDNEHQAHPKWMIGKHTAHLNKKGYQKWAEHLLPYLEGVKR